jgi:hypothetical protein
LLLGGGAIVIISSNQTTQTPSIIKIEIEDLPIDETITSKTSVMSEVIS